MPKPDFWRTYEALGFLTKLEQQIAGTLRMMVCVDDFGWFGLDAEIMDLEKGVFAA